MMTTNINNLGGLITDLKLTQAKIGKALGILEMSNETFYQKFLASNGTTSVSTVKRGRKPGSKNRKTVSTATAAAPSTAAVPPVTITGQAASSNKRSEAQRARWARVNAIKATNDTTTVSA